MAGPTGPTGPTAAVIAVVATRCARGPAKANRPTATGRRRHSAPATSTPAKRRGAAGLTGRRAPSLAAKAPDPAPGSAPGTAWPTLSTAAVGPLK